jgi:hypothetical protein
MSPIGAPEIGHGFISVANGCKKGTRTKGRDDEDERGANNPSNGIKNGPKKDLKQDSP